jgi:maleamate amidohydrolase
MNQHTLANDDLKEYYDGMGYGGRVGFGSRPALVIIDLAKAWVDPNSPIGTPRLEQTVLNTVTILEEARAAGIPTFFTVMSYDSELKEPGRNMLAKSRHLKMMTRGSHWLELDPRLERRDDEPLIHKQRASAFFGTTFLSQLIDAEADTLVIVGCSTSGCIRATAESSSDLNFRTIVVGDTVNDRSESAHEANLFDIDNRYADVVSMSAIVEYFNGIAAKSLSA